MAWCCEFDVRTSSLGSCKVRVGSNGNLLWEASVLLGRKKGGVRVAREDDRGVTEGREDVREVFQQSRSVAKRKLSRCGRNQLGNEPILALLEGADDFVVYYDARSKDLEACLEKGRRFCHIMLEALSERDMQRRRSEAKNEFELDLRQSDLGLRKGCWWYKIRLSKQKNASRKMFVTSGPTSVKRCESGTYRLDTGLEPPFGRCKDLVLKRRVFEKYSIHSGADTVTILWAVTGESKLNGYGIGARKNNKDQHRLWVVEGLTLESQVGEFCLVGRVSEIGLGGAESLSKPEIAWIL
ncbi:hypothetical protein Tco_0335238 [Tanacetum coccineum]